MAEVDRATLAAIVAEWQEEAREIQRVMRYRTEKVETLEQCAAQVAVALLDPAPVTIGDVPKDAA